MCESNSASMCQRVDRTGGRCRAQAVPLLDGTRTAPLAAGLLYQLSLDDEGRAAFCYCPGGLNRLLDSILRALGPSSAGRGVHRGRVRSCACEACTTVWQCMASTGPWKRVSDTGLKSPF